MKINILTKFHEDWIKLVPSRVYTRKMFCRSRTSNSELNNSSSQNYCISLIIRQSFSFQNNPKDLDPSCKVDPDRSDCLGRVKIGIIANFHRTDLVI